MDSLGLSSSFSVLNALRSLEPDESQLVVVEFRPQKLQIIRQQLCLYSQSSKVSSTPLHAL